MDLLQMKYVIAIAEHESMTKAAEELHVSQSALSLSYKRLEEELGVRLFQRDGRTLQLTLAGRYFCDKSREILKLVGELQQRMAAEDSLEYTSELGDFSNEARMLYGRFYPDRKILEMRHNAAETMRVLRSGAAAFALTCYDKTDNDVISELILEEPMYGFVSTASPLSECGVLFMNQICDKPLITQQQDFSIANVMVEFFEKSGLYTPARHFVTDPESMSLTVFNGFGYTFIPESIVNMWKRSPFEMSPGTKMIPMAEPYCKRRVYLTYMRHAPKTELTTQYMEYLRHFGALTQRLHDIPQVEEMEKYAEKYHLGLYTKGN